MQSAPGWCLPLPGDLTAFMHAPASLPASAFGDASIDAVGPAVPSSASAVDDPVSAGDEEADVPSSEVDGSGLGEEGAFADSRSFNNVSFGPEQASNADAKRASEITNARRMRARHAKIAPCQYFCEATDLDQRAIHRPSAIHRAPAAMLESVKSLRSDRFPASLSRMRTPVGQ